MRKLVEFLKGVLSFIMATSWLLRIVLLLTTYDLAVDKFDFAPVQSPDMRSSRRKKILVQGDEPQNLSVKFLFWGGKGNFGGQKIKNKDKNRFAAYTFFNLSNNSTNFMAYRGDNLALLSLNILINY